MKRIFAGMMAVTLLAPVAVQAQETERNPLAGPHIGVDVVRDALEANQPTSTRNASRRGFGGRINAGYDAVIGDIALIGAEIGIGTGGRTVDQASLAGGRYRVNPGITYDATARLGIAPGGGFALYGRAGYRWLRTEQSVTGQTLGNFSRKVTEKGFTYGGGAEYAVSPNFSLRAEFNRTKFSRDLRQNKISLGAAIRF
ncbi:MAG: outer membrane protein [Sphingomonadaceae bacterium]